MFFGERMYKTPTPLNGFDSKDEDIVHAFREKGLINFVFVFNLVELDMVKLIHA